MFFPDVKIQWKRQKSSISKNAVKLKPLKIKSWNLQVKSSRYRCLRISQFYSHNWLNNVHLSNIKITWKLICTDTTEVVSVQIFSWLYLNLEFFSSQKSFCMWFSTRSTSNIMLKNILYLYCILAFGGTCTDTTDFSDVEI